MKLGFADGALKGRLLAIIVLTVVSGGSFALGYLVGTSAGPRDSAGLVEEEYEEPAAAREESAGAIENLAGAAEEPMEPIDLPEVIEDEPAASAAPASAGAPRAKKLAAKKAAPEAWSVQVGLFEDRKYAEDLVRRLKGRGYPAYIDESGGAYKVKVGKFAAREEAGALAGKLKGEGISGFVTGPG